MHALFDESTSPDGKGVETELPLWDGMRATEYFPATEWIKRFVATKSVALS